MTKAKRVLALLLAVIMASLACTTAFARNVDPEAYKSDPWNHMNSINVITLTAEEGCTQILDKLDDLLYNANIKFNHETVTSVIGIDVKLTLDLSSVDGVLWSLWNIIRVAHNHDGDCLGNIVDVGSVGNWLLDTFCGTIAGMLGDLQDLTADSLTDQNINSRVCRNWPVKGGLTKGNDLEVLGNLTHFLSDNRVMLKKVVTGGVELGTIGSLIIGKIEIADKILNDFTGWLRDLLYSKLWDTDADAAPSGFTYDAYAQKLINWLTYEGTGSTSEDGGKSVLGSDFEAFLPALENQPGKADIRNQSTYALVNNIIQALLSGMVGDLLKDLLKDLLGAEATDQYPYGDPAIVQDVLFATIVGAVKGLLEQNGAPELVFSDLEKNYPIPQIDALIDWLFDGGALDVFIHIEEGKIEITDAFMSLLGDVIRILPGLFPLLNINVPGYIKLDDGVIGATKSDDTHGNLYLTFEGDEIYIDPDETIYYIGDNEGGNIDFSRTPTLYVATDRLVNVSDSTAADYHNPKFIRTEKIMPNSEVYAYILKIVLNSVIDGCYFPEWTTSVASVGAYGLASLAARYIPQNNYFDRLDKYHYDQLGQPYNPKGTNVAVTALPYTEVLTLAGGKSVTIPRAAADIGASLGAFFLNGEFGVLEGLNSKHNTDSFETDTNFETFGFEFLFWGAREYMKLLTGEFDYNSDTFKQFTAFGVSADAPFRSAFNTAWSNYVSLLNQYPSTGTLATGRICNIPASSMRSVLFNLIDSTLFVLFPKKVLPNWLADSGSPGESLIYYWLGDSVTNFDLQQLISLLSANTDSDAPLKRALLPVLVRLIDRVLGTLFGGNAVIKPVTGPAVEGSGNDRKVFTTSTTMTGLDDLLSADSLGQLLCGLLYYLNIYISPLAYTIFPLLASKAVKDYQYYETSQAYAGGQSKVNFLGSGAVTIDNLEQYIESLDGDYNSSVFSGGIPYNTTAKAIEVAEALEYTDYDPNLPANQTTINGSVKYVVTFPASYTKLSVANAAAELASQYTGNNCSVVTKRDGQNRTYFVMEKLNYLTTTADEAVTYSGEEATYTYTNFRRAPVITAAHNGSVTTRTGPKGEVQYGDGYRALYTEDYTANTNFNYLRYADAIKDAREFTEEFRTYSEKTLPNAYGAWLMYFVKMQLLANSKYDKDDNGAFDATKDTNPGMPEDPYPFKNTSGSSSDVGYGKNDSYPFSANETQQVVAAALSYAADSENDVTLSIGDAESVVRLALNTIGFDITPSSNGSYNNGSKQWNTLTAADISNIQSTCTALGLTYHAADADHDTPYITRKAFALFGPSLMGKQNFGNYYTYTTDDNGNITGIDTTTSISLTPLSSYTLGAEGGEKQRCELQKAYIDFASTAKEYTENVKNRYDDISWRAENCENAVLLAPALNTIKFVRKLTENAYDPLGVGKNKTYSNSGAIVPIYSKSTFTPFQRAYEYAVQIIHAVETGTEITPSVITVAYQTLLDAYKKLELFSGLADWTSYEAALELAQSVLDSPMGVDANGQVKDPLIGYTQASLTNLLAAYNAAYTYWTQNHETLDSDNNDLILEKASELRQVINACEFPEGIYPDLAILDNGQNPDLALTHDGPRQSFMVNGKILSRQQGVISGLQEYVGFTEDIKDSSLYFSGVLVDGNNVKPAFEDSGRGWGTGAYFSAYGNAGEYVRYYAVILGDINGDAVIDGVDKTYLDVYTAQALTSSLESYRQAAADVDCDGDIDMDDILKIKAHYTFANQQGISGNVNGTIDQTQAIHILAPDTTGA